LSRLAIAGIGFAAGCGCGGSLHFVLASVAGGQGSGQKWGDWPLFAFAAVKSYLHGLPMKSCRNAGALLFGYCVATSVVTAPVDMRRLAAPVFMRRLAAPVFMRRLAAQ
jgi:hypothetical protein